MWFDLMVDIETMGMPPSGALVGLGCAFFDIAKREIGPTFYRAVNLTTAVDVGMKIDPATVLWWLGQSEPARRSIMWQTSTIQSALSEFNEFLAEHSRVRDLRVYGNAPSFDLQIMATAYKLALGTGVPWHFTNERDFRSVRAMYPAVEYNTDDKGDDAHNALADAIFQIKHLFKIADYARAKR